MEYIIIGLFIVVVLMMAIANNVIGSEEVPKVCNGLHNWVTDQNEKLVCMECGYRPETNQ